MPDRIDTVKGDYRLAERLGKSLREQLEKKWQLQLRQRVMHRRNRAKINDYRRQIFVGHVPEILIAHNRNECPTVVADAFANCPREHVVGPGARTRFHVGCEIWKSDLQPESWDGLNCSGAHLRG